MKARTAYYMLLAAGMFTTGMGHYVVGPVLTVLAVIYRERIVDAEERGPRP